MKNRKIEVVEVSILDGVIFRERGFSELGKNDIFKITDLDENGKIAIDGEDGTQMYYATSDPYMGDEYTIDMVEFEGDDEDLMRFYLEDVSGLSLDW